MREAAQPRMYAGVQMDRGHHAQKKGPGLLRALNGIALVMDY
jgi:hypothetical protein